jgi:hypothetical protein
MFYAERGFQSSPITGKRLRLGISIVKAVDNVTEHVREKLKNKSGKQNIFIFQKM